MIHSISKMADQCDDDDQITEDAIINAAVTFDDEVKDAIQQVSLIYKEKLFVPYI